MKLEPYKAQLMARAVENQMWVVASNVPANTKDMTGSHGQSRIVNPDGNVVKEASFFKEEVVTETLTIKQPLTLSISGGKILTPVEKFKSEWWRSNPLIGPMAEWWRDGVVLMMKNRNKPLE